MDKVSFAERKVFVLGGEKSKMIKIQAIGIGIIALSLLACSIGLVIVEDQDEEYTVIDAGNRSFKVSIPIPNAEGDAAHLIPSGSIIHYSAGKAIIKKENDYEWAIATEKGRIYGVKKEGEKLIVPISGHPSELQEEDLVLIKKLLTLPIGAIHKNFMWLKPGESGETYYTLYTRNGGPGEVSYKIYRVAGVGEKEEMAMPEGLEVSIEPSKFMAQPHKNYTSKITVKSSHGFAGSIAGREYTLYLQVVFEGEKETISDNWLRVLVAPSPNQSELQKEWILAKAPPAVPVGGIHRNYLWLKPGETGETYYTFYTRNGGPGEVSYKIYRVAGVGEKEEMAMPEGLEVSIEPSKFMAQPHKNYTSKITVKSSHGFAGSIAGREYTLYLQVVFEGEKETISDNWLRVLVAPSPNQSELQKEWILAKAPPAVPVGGIHRNYLWLKPGETGETYYTFYTRNGGPGEVSYKIYRVAGVGKKEEIAMPEGLEVSIEPSKFIAQPHENYTSKITVKTSPGLVPYIPPTVSPEGFLEHSPIITVFTLHLQANFEGENETIGDDWLRVVVSQSSLGGVAGCFPCGYRSKSITLKPGETRETYYTAYTGTSEPGVVSYEIYRVGGVDGEEKIPMPEGLRVSIEPSKFFAQPCQSYISKIRIETSPELSPSEYSLRIHVKSEYGGSGGGLTVNVV